MSAVERRHWTQQPDGPLGPMQPAEFQRLEQLEQAIDEGIKTFLSVGNALAEVRDHRLYRDHFDSFEAYCSLRWAISRPRAYELMHAAEVVSAIADSDPSAPLPENEAQARALQPVKDDPDEMADVMSAVAEKGKVTAKALEDEIAARHPKPSPLAPATPVGDPAPPPPTPPSSAEAEHDEEVVLDEWEAECEQPNPLPAPRPLPKKSPSERAWEPHKALAKGIRTMPTAREVMSLVPADSVEEFDRLADEAVAWGRRWKEERKAATRLQLMGVK